MYRALPELWGGKRALSDPSSEAAPFVFGGSFFGCWAPGPGCMRRPVPPFSLLLTLDRRPVPPFDIVRGLGTHKATPGRPRPLDGLGRRIWSGVSPKGIRHLSSTRVPDHREGPAPLLNGWHPATIVAANRPPPTSLPRPPKTKCGAIGILRAISGRLSSTQVRLSLSLYASS